MIVDASVILAAFFPDEAQARAQALIRDHVIGRRQLAAPTLLLYEVTNCLKELGLYIDVAKISTKVDQVADTFYVRDIFGTKIKEEQKLEEIRSRLLAVLNEDDKEK